MRIYVYKMPSGAFWAEYSQEVAARSGDIVRVFSADTQADAEDIAHSPGVVCPERVTALAERAIKEGRFRQEPQEEPAPIPRRIRERGFWGKIKWALFNR